MIVLIECDCIISTFHTSVFIVIFFLKNLIHFTDRAVVLIKFICIVQWCLPPYFKIVIVKMSNEMLRSSDGSIFCLLILIIMK